MVAVGKLRRQSLGPGAGVFTGRSPGLLVTQGRDGTRKRTGVGGSEGWGQGRLLPHRHVPAQNSREYKNSKFQYGLRAIAKNISQGRRTDMFYFQFSSVAQSCLTMRPHGLQRARPYPVHQQLPELTQTHVH